MLQIGPYSIATPTILAPMAGVSDLPFRNLCAQLGAGLVVNEMVTSDTRLWHTAKSRTRLVSPALTSPHVVQIAGGESAQMAAAARAACDYGAQVIDINMGCPAKKVCNRAAGSALLRDEPLVADILEAVVHAVNLPVTLKIRTGWDTASKNGVQVARLAERCGIVALTVHGRTRACRFNGSAEYDTIAEIVDTVNIPVIANGDIASPEMARHVLDYTKAAAVMIGRAAQGNPWIFSDVNNYLRGTPATPRSLSTVKHTILHHFEGIYGLYGEAAGVRIARKHLHWYLARQTNTVGHSTVKELQQRFNTTTTASKQHVIVCQIFDRLLQLEDHAA